MNTSIGIRVKPDCIIYSIIKDNEYTKEIRIIDKINVPVALQIPEQLKFIQCTLLDIILKNHVRHYIAQIVVKGGIMGRINPLSSIISLINN